MSDSNPKMARTSNFIIMFNVVRFCCCFKERLPQWRMTEVLPFLHEKMPWENTGVRAAN